MKNNGAVSKIITFVLGLLLCGYIGYQVYRAVYNPVRTVSAVYTEVDDSVPLDGCVVRDESIIAGYSGSGVLEMSMYEGERTANGSTVAVVYADESAAEKSHKASELDREIKSITALYSQSAETYDINSINEQIFEYAMKIVSAEQDGMLDGISSATENLKAETLLREYVYRDKSELLTVIDELKKERTALGNAGAIKKRITAPRTGYFSNTTDGYEKILNSNLINSIKPSEFEEMLKNYAEPESGAVGKLITSNKWYFAAVVSENDASRFSLKSVMKLKFSDKSLPSAEGKVIRISEPENGKCLIVFSCNTHIGNFTRARKVSAEAVITTYSGLKVPRRALRVNEDGQNGVNCLIESQIKFKPIKIIFEKDSYYVAAYDTADTKSLLLYDEIVVSGKELKNKKIIK